MRVLRRKGEQRNSPANGWAPQFPPSANDGLAIADVWACVRVLAGSAASLPLVPYRRQGEGRVRLTSGRLYELLQTPSWATTQANLIGQGMSHLLLHGNAYLGKFRGGDGRLEQLSLLDPLNVSVELVAGSPRYTVTDPKTGRESYHGTDDILQVRGVEHRRVGRPFTVEVVPPGGRLRPRHERVRGGVDEERVPAGRDRNGPWWAERRVDQQAGGRLRG